MDLPNEINSTADDELLMVDLPTPKPSETKSFEKLVEESKLLWAAAGDSDAIDKVVFQDEDFYDVAKDSFRYGRMTTGTSYNLVTGKMPEKVFEAVRAKDEEIDDEEEMEAPEDPKTVVSKFHQQYDCQMPKFFEYRSTFPQINGIWTMLFDQQHYQEMSTYELQAAICAALNSKHHLIICVGVDEYNSVTGVEMSAVDRVVFRMALTRAVVGEFQPPLVKLAPKQLTGISPMKRDVAELLPSIDVLFVPVIGGPRADKDEGLTNRFLIVVRLKEISEKLYQLSSGRIYVEKEGRVVEMASLDEAFNQLVIDKPQSGSFFMLDQEPFMESFPVQLESVDIDKPQEKIATPITPTQKCNPIISYPDIENIGWILFGSAVAFGVYRAINALAK